MSGNPGADVPTGLLRGVIAAAATLDETRRLIAEAVEFHIHELRLSGQPLPKAAVVETGLVEVK